jgi:hypothetical protein
MEDKVTIILQYKDKISEFQTHKINSLILLKKYSEDLFNATNISLFYFDMDMTPFINETLFNLFKCKTKITLNCIDTNTSYSTCKCGKDSVMYCRDCSEYICVVCNNDHSSHNFYIDKVRSISKYCNLLMNSLNEINLKIQENTIENYDFIVKKDKLINKIEKIYEIFERCNKVKVFTSNFDISRVIKLMGKKISNISEIKFEKLTELDRIIMHLNKSLNKLSEYKGLISKMNEIQDRLENFINEMFSNIKTLINSNLDNAKLKKTEIMFSQKINKFSSYDFTNLTKFNNKVKKINMFKKINGCSLSRSHKELIKNDESNSRRQSMTNFLISPRKSNNILIAKIPILNNKESPNLIKQISPLKNKEIIEKPINAADKNFRRRSRGILTKIEDKIKNGVSTQTYENDVHEYKLKFTIDEISCQEESENDYESNSSTYEIKLFTEQEGESKLPILQKLNIPRRPSRPNENNNVKRLSKLGTINLNVEDVDLSSRRSVFKL